MEKRFNEYIKRAMRTCSVPTKTDQISHGTMGLVSEVGEVAGVVQKFYQGHDIDRRHFLLELGDILWMVAELARAIEIEHYIELPETEEKADEIKSAICRLAYQSSSIVNLMRSKTPKATLALYFSEIIKTISELAQAFSSSLDEVMAMNIEKLKKRYPDGFKSERSIYRDNGDI